MANLPVDRDSNYMKSMWGTTRLITDYYTDDKKVIQEVLHDLAPPHKLYKQNELHEKIRNDVDYDDWEYGTEPVYNINTKSDKTTIIM